MNGQNGAARSLYLHRRATISTPRVASHLPDASRYLVYTGWHQFVYITVLCVTALPPRRGALHASYRRRIGRAYTYVEPTFFSSY